MAVRAVGKGSDSIGSNSPGEQRDRGDDASAKSAYGSRPRTARAASGERLSTTTSAMVSNRATTAQALDWGCSGVVAYQTAPRPIPLQCPAQRCTKREIAMTALTGVRSTGTNSDLEERQTGLRTRIRGTVSVCAQPNEVSC